ncbi:unnamed protein product [Thelazia callipaeda]|uniref:HABP4_PAI-RBP1 domain-containing protein n=1 Tax=Thelazia callipaeda TaxID=103827 RepID=A0A0N5CJW2_THECL|nr:unnamed protein product [Thelazia callipaeda]
MVEYGVNVTNKFGFLSDDEVDDPEVILRKAEALTKKDERSSHQRKADKSAAMKKKKEIAATVVTTLSKENAVKNHSQTSVGSRIKKNEFNKENKENRPEDRVRGRGRGRGGGNFGRGRGAVQVEHTRSTIYQNSERDVIAERFGEGRGRGRGRGGRGRPFPRGGRNGTRNLDRDHELTAVDSHNELNGNGNHNHFGSERQNITDSGPPRGSYRGGRGGYRGGIDREFERPAFRGGRGRGGRQFDRMSGSDRTGLKSLDKKSGFGKANWGTEHDDLVGQNEPIDFTNGVGKTDDAVQRERVDEFRLDAEADERAKQLTLDEFKAKIAAKRSKPHFNIRQAGEGTNDKDFGKLVPLNKPVMEENCEEEIVVVRREPRTKRLDIEINFADDQRGSRGNRVRDGFASGRGTYNEQGRNFKPNQVFEVSADAFPALGSH